MFVYLFQSQEDGYYKIGVSKSPQKRLIQLQTGNSSKIKLVEIYQSENAFKIEKRLHQLYKYAKKEGEWFDLYIEDIVDFTKNCKVIDENIDFLKKSNNIFK